MLPLCLFEFLRCVSGTHLNPPTRQPYLEAREPEPEPPVVSDFPPRNSVSDAPVQTQLAASRLKFEGIGEAPRGESRGMGLGF